MYEQMTPEKIKADILSGLKSDLDTREGSFSDDMAGPLALELFKVYGALNAIQPMVWVDETSGKYLDYAAADLGIPPRKTGTKATVQLKVTGDAGYTVPFGKLFVSNDGRQFKTTAETIIPESGMVLVLVEANQAGSAWNVPANEIIRQYENDSRIKSAFNPESATGGTDQEGDQSLYKRIVATRQKPSTSGNLYDYEKWALETPGVGAALVSGLWDGPGTVKVLIAGIDKRPVDAAVVSSCAAYIEQMRPVGAKVTVLSARALSVNVTAQVTIDSSADKNTVQEAFSAVLDRYLQELAMEKDEVLYSRVGALLVAVDGVIDYTGLKLNGLAQSVAVGEEEVPLIGEVIFT